jgi:transposase-like protein
LQRTIQSPHEVQGVEIKVVYDFKQTCGPWRVRFRLDLPRLRCEGLAPPFEHFERLASSKADEEIALVAVATTPVGSTTLAWVGIRLHAPSRTRSAGKTIRFAPAQKRDAVLAVLTKRKTVSEVCRELQVSETSFNRWREQPLEAIEDAMKDKADRAEPNADLERRLAEAERTIGKLALENELLGKASRWLT